MAKKSGLVKTIANKLLKLDAYKKSGHGPWENGGTEIWDNKPYTHYYSNGIFVGQDGNIWKYYKVPSDVAIEWLIDPSDAIENQWFFNNVAIALGQLLDNQPDKTRGDLRRPFHVQITQSPTLGITPPKGATAAKKDYLRRMSSQYTKPDWFGYVGVQLMPQSIFHDAHGVQAQLERYAEFITNASSVEWIVYKKDIEDLDRIMFDNGFTELDFIESRIDLEQLTAWHGVEDRQYGLPRQLQSIKMREPVQGLSILVPKFGEIMFHALVPDEGVNLKDPMSDSTRWATPLYRPGSGVVLVNIRGQIRAPSIMDNLLELKGTNKSDKLLGSAVDPGQIELIQLARYAATELKMPMLDNLEIVVGSKVPKAGKHMELVDGMRAFGIVPRPLQGRQHLGLLTSFPCYPRQVLAVPRGNRKRPELSNVMLPGMISMSGIFRATKPCGPGGFIMGLGDSGDEYQPVFTEVDAANKYNSVPGILITGRPGAGKALALDTPIPTPTGWTTMGELKVGDTVFASSGKTCKVTFVTETFTDHDCYLVELEDGQMVVADADHQWVVQTPSDRHFHGTREWYAQSLVEQAESRASELRALADDYPKELPEYVHRDELTEFLAQVMSDPITKRPRSIAAMLDFNEAPYIDGENHKQLYHGVSALRSLALRMEQKVARDARLGKSTRRMTTVEMVEYIAEHKNNFISIPLIDAPVEYPEQDLPVDPYVLGAWLGDGNGTEIAAADIGDCLNRSDFSDMVYMRENIESAGYSVARKSDYVLRVRGLAAHLEALGVLGNKHVPEVYKHSSVEQRLALIQGLFDTDGHASLGGQAIFSNTNPRLLEAVVEILRSLGVKVHWKACECGAGYDCGCYKPYVSRRKSEPVMHGKVVKANHQVREVQVTTSLPMFRLPRKLERQNRTPGKRTYTNMIRTIKPVVSVPVRCISVDSESSTYLANSFLAQSNTQQLLQLTCQAAYDGLPVFFLNPKKTGTLKPTFDHIGGVTVSMNVKYLDQNPGLLDPVFWLTDRREVAARISAAIFQANRMYEDTGSTANARRVKISRELHERAMDHRNKCSYDIIFGNARLGTEPLSDAEAVAFVRDKMEVSPFWRAFISVKPVESELQRKMNQGASVLVEWDSSMTLPSADKSPAEYDDNEVDAVLSVNLVFHYSISKLQNTGGVFIADESWVFKNNKESKAILEVGGREWRQANISLILGTQRITDWMMSEEVAQKMGVSATNMSSYFARYLFMAISPNDQDDLKMFFQLTQQPRTKKLEKYMIDAGVSSVEGAKSRSIPRGFYMDTIYGWSGGILCGPWPARELGLGRTDKAGVENRSKTSYGADTEALEASGFSGALLDALAEDMDED